MPIECTSYTVEISQRLHSLEFQINFAMLCEDLALRWIAEEPRKATLLLLER
jgi:hypothetical protein